MQTYLAASGEISVSKHHFSKHVSSRISLNSSELQKMFYSGKRYKYELLFNPECKNYAVM